MRRLFSSFVVKVRVCDDFEFKKIGVRKIIEKCSEVKWSEVKWKSTKSVKKCSEVKWKSSKTVKKCSEVKCSEVKII